MKQYYECHITMTGDPMVLRKLVEANSWKFSAIDGDPVLGQGVKCYATMFYNLRRPLRAVTADLHYVADRLREGGAEILRKKIEQVVYDDRIRPVKCRPECPCAGKFSL